ncbi:troponin C, isoallergen Bla g 6.0101 [Aethina tumida]|uniref:troponin C, isoallergen Bla g 6.0101 n=1 Tax=Aethina tumida TaxID=116153 RepID=UPI00096B0F4C|nr:troponin C, isoallergen Bla g 6.0101 [Aethina tumida]
MGDAPAEPKKENVAKDKQAKSADPEPVLDYEALKDLDIAKDQLKMLKTIFDSFDLEKSGEIAVDMIGQILDMLGNQLSPEELQKIIQEIDEDGNGVMSFNEFAHLAARFLVEEEEDTEQILKELKDAFRLYDKEGLGYITVDLLREILKELDEKMTPSDLEQMIEEIDTDKSGTVDWEEFKAMMIG